MQKARAESDKVMAQAKEKALKILELAKEKAGSQVSDYKEKLKKGIVSAYLFPEVAVVDPKLTIGLPPSVTAFTGMDALTHAIESYCSVNATHLSDLFAYRAMEIIAKT
jgi:alcohol dehydrogenase class IV